MEKQEVSTIEMINRCLIKDIFDYKYTEMLFDLLRLYEKEDQTHAHKLNKIVRSIASKQALNNAIDFNTRLCFRDLYKRSLLFSAKVDFDSFLLYVEFNRRPEKKFYQPRRKVLRVVVQDLQDLYDRKIKLLAVSLPPRVGKSTLGCFFMSWLVGLHYDLPSLMVGYGDRLARGFYKEVQGIINGEEYLWHDVFPNDQIKKISADDLTIDINKDSRYPTLTCRSIAGALTGIVDIKLILYADDLIEDIEEALNPTRMDAKYAAYVSQCKDRKSIDAFELHIGTRWNVNDVIGRVMDQYEGNPEYRFRVIPALNENDESNFDYDFGVGFDTAYYHDMRDTLEKAGDIATWHAKYQGEPYVREGLVFPEGALKYFKKKELPMGVPVKYMANDVAWGGGDSLSSPIAHQYGNDEESIYIVDWIFSKGDKDETRPIVKAKIIEHKPDFIRFEANNGGDMYAESVEKDLKDKNYRFNITSVTTTGGKNASKHAEILAYAPDIRKFHFLVKEERTPEYNNAMKELFQYLQNGKAKHDDSPDGLKQLAKMILEGSGSYEIGDRPF